MDDARLTRTLARHDGLITLAQARAAGCSARVVSEQVWSGRWRCVAPRTYRVDRPDPRG